MNIRKSCLGCLYRRPTSAMNQADTVCHYLLDTGSQRGCSADNCSHWLPSAGCELLVELVSAGGDPLELAD